MSSFLHGGSGNERMGGGQSCTSIVFKRPLTTYQLISKIAMMTPIYGSFTNMMNFYCFKVKAGTKERVFY